LRARIVLACAEGSQNKEVAAKLGVVEVTVGKFFQSELPLGSIFRYNLIYGKVNKG
jgi:hypothetical protein